MKCHAHTPPSAVNMAAPMEHMRTENMKIHFSMRSGASLVSVKPIFSHDEKYLFVCSADVIKVYSTVSGECLRELVGHEGTVTGLVLHPKNTLQILSCSKDKYVMVWDYADGIKLKSYPIGMPMIGIFTCGKENSVFLLTTRQGLSSSDTDAVLIETTLADKKSTQKTVMSGCSNDIHKIAVGPKGLYCAMVMNTKLIVKDLQAIKSQTFKHTVESTHAFSCISSHPNGMCLATGCKDGTIYLWYKFLSKNAVKSTLHWHSLSVRDLTFTPEGSYLMSGGHECVLVKWHQQTEYRDFLPRLGAPINHIVCSGDNQLYALCLEDNVIQVVTSSFAVQQVYQGLTRSNSSTIPAGLRCDPRTQALVLNGKPGHIQFYSVHEDKQLFNLDIVCQNFISADSLDKPLKPTEITHARFDEKGEWLSTVEYWNDGQMSPEIRLKFWVFNEETQGYTLNTTAEQAHIEKIGSLEFRPPCVSDGLGASNMVVTTSADGKFKLWTLTDDSDIYRENIKWVCQSVGFYRDIPAGSTAFSEDGTLLAVVFESCITLWDPDTNLLRETLVNNAHQSKINHILFGNQNCSQFLISCTDSTLTVWNLINCAISWSADYAVASITKDPATDFIAAFSTNKQLHVFKPSSPTPVFINQDVCQNEVIGSVFIPHSNNDLYKDTPLEWQRRSELYFMDHTQQLFSVSLLGANRQAKSKDDLISIEENLPQSALSWIMKGHTNRSGLRVDQTAVTIQPHQQYLKEILSSPAHVQPSVYTLCQPFLKSLLVPLSNSSGDLEKNEEEDDPKQTDESQTGSIDSGLDSDSDMDTTENQSTEIQTQSGSKQKNESQSRIHNGEDEGKGKKLDLSVQNVQNKQRDIDLTSTVFMKSLGWYSTKGSKVS